MSDTPKLSLGRAEKVAGGALIVQSVLALVVFLCARYSRSPAVLAEAWTIPAEGVMGGSNRTSVEQQLGDLREWLEEG